MERDALHARILEKLEQPLVTEHSLAQFAVETLLEKTFQRRYHDGTTHFKQQLLQHHLKLLHRSYHPKCLSPTVVERLLLHGAHLLSMLQRSVIRNQMAVLMSKNTFVGDGQLDDMAQLPKAVALEKGQSP